MNLGKFKFLLLKMATAEDNYTESVLRTQYALHKEYVKGRMASGKALKVKFRLPSIPEDISENIVKFIIHKNGDKTSTWNCEGDLKSTVEGKQECKCFTSNGPLSFSPSSEWDVIYFLDARKWLEDKFVLFRIQLRRDSDNWKRIKMSSTQTFEDQCKQGRRPRMPWEHILKNIPGSCDKVFEGSFEDIFTPLVTGPSVEQ